MCECFPNSFFKKEEREESRFSTADEEKEDM
jgi:hypothetical protein